MFLKSAFSLVAFLVLAALVWLVGPIVSIGEWQPLQKTGMRILVLALLGLLIFGPLAYRYWLLRKAEQALKTGLLQQDEQSRIQNARLQEIFHQAIQVLKQHQVRKAWYLAKPGLYELPWYVIIGPPGSGKTTLLKNSGLRFPLQDLHGRNSIKGVGGTRNCDWWFTDQAVLIDTAGRFTTQDSDQNTDAAGWNAFLDLLKKYRPRQPVNGVLLTLSVQDLLDTEQKRQETASRIALRLQEMTGRLGMCPPVYVLVTKLDLLNGFQETFGRLGEQERTQAWGFNFPCPNDLGTMLKTALPEALMDMTHHLGDQLGWRMQQENQENRRAKLFEFPLAFSRLVPVIQQLLEQAFQSGSIFEKPVVLRGIYFCSGTQETSMFDRMLSARAAPPALPELQETTGKGFFIRNFLLQVAFAEQHLAAYVRKKALLHLGMYWGVLAAVLGGAFMLCAGWWISWSNNSSAVAATLARGHSMAMSAGSSGNEVNLLPLKLFETLSQLVQLAPVSPPGLNHHLGLNQDDKLQQAQKIAYHNALGNKLMPYVSKRLEERLRQALNQDDVSAYEALKAYLMLYTPQHFEAASLTGWVVEDWKKNLLNGLDEKTREQAIEHLKAAIALGVPAELPEKNLPLIQNARDIIGSRPQEERLYQRMLQLFKSENQAHPAPFENIPPAVAALLVRNSGKPLGHDIEAFYTRSAYLNFFLPRLPQEAARLSREAAWVMGERTAAAQLADTAGLFQALRENHLRAYVRHWDEYLKDIRLKNPDSFEQAVEFSRILASSQSPLKKFLEEVAKNTRLSPGEVNRLPVENSLEQKVDEHFSAINNLFDGKSPTYTQVTAMFSELYGRLAAISAARSSGNAPPAQDALNAVLVTAGLMPDPVRAIATQLAAQGGAQGQIAERANLSADLQPLAEVCRRTVANRYPVQAGSGLDILPDDFSRFFGPGGLMDQFFESRLAGRVDTGGPGWKLKTATSNSPAVQAASQLVQFQHAARIRDAFFPGSTGAPGFDVEMRLLNATPANDVFYLEIDGELKMFSAQHQPVHKIRWGGQAPTSLLRIKASEGEYRSFHGPWALFRLFDNGKPAGAGRPEQFQIRFEMEGKTFDFEVRANSVFNPLRLKELRQFRCPVAL